LNAALSSSSCPFGRRGDLSSLRFGSKTRLWLDSSFFSFTNGGITTSSWNQSTSTITAIPEPSTYIAVRAQLVGHGYSAARNCGMPDYSCLS
jgi:hypothetical protein